MVTPASKKLTLTLRQCNEIHTRWMDGSLPTEVMQEILSRLPIDSLFNCRYACKPWKALTKDPRLLLMHYTKSSQTQNHKPTHLLLCTPHEEPDLYYISDLDTCSKAIKLNNLPFRPWLPSFRIAGSSNGFLCLSDVTGSYHTLFICNPLSGDCRRLPENPNFTQVGAFFGFGCTPQTNVYKAIKMSHNRVQKNLTVQLLTIGTNSWRVIGIIPRNISSRLKSGVSLNGCLHWWLVLDGCIVVGIKTFDLEIETFGVLPVPDSVKDKKIGTELLHLGVFQGCLVLVDYSQQDIQVWLLIDYCANKCWTSKFFISRSHIIRMQRLLPVCVQTNGNLLLVTTYQLLSYDPKTKTCQTLLDRGRPAQFETFPHVGTMVTLNDAIATEHL